MIFKKEYIYYVSYILDNTEFGNCVVSRTRKIKSYDDIIYLNNTIASMNDTPRKLVILNYRRIK